jgi:hypothetical protein
MTATPDQPPPRTTVGIAENAVVGYFHAMNPRSIILALSLSMFSAVYADDFDTPGERAALQRQLGPLGLPSWHALKPVSQASRPEFEEMILKRVQRLNSKLDAIIIPKIDFERKPLREVVSWIRDETQRIDSAASEPEKGVNILIRLFDGADTTAPPPVTLHLSNVTVRETLNQLATPLNARIEVSSYAAALRRN